MSSLPNETVSPRRWPATSQLVEDSWNRAQLLGLDPEIMHIERRNPLIDDQVISAARRVIRSTAAALDDTTTWISLADVHGAIAYDVVSLR